MPKSKLTLNQVSQIREAFESGKLQKLLAKEYNVTPATISRIVTYRMWL
jgi:hypothetical protein